MRPRVGITQGQWGHVDAWGCENGMNVPFGASRRPILAIWVHHRVVLLAPLVPPHRAGERQGDRDGS